MPPELRKAHQLNDKAVMQAYGFWGRLNYKAVMQAYGFWGRLNSEPKCVAELMKMYQALTTGKE